MGAAWEPAADTEAVSAEAEKEAKVEAEAGTNAGFPATAPRRGPAARAAALAAAVQAALVPGAELELRTDEGVDVAVAVARALRATGADASDGDSGAMAAPSADFLAASFVAYADERAPVSLQDWCVVLQEVLDDANIVLDEDDARGSVRRVIERVVRAGCLRAKDKLPELGDIVLAVLTEDDEWHHAVVDAVEESGQLRIIFLDYNKPQSVAAHDVRGIEDVADEGNGEVKDGECELCHRVMKLTFHHLIPKDRHSAYLGKRLPKGIEGEPTRVFLNSYGVTICRCCHNMVHSIASNELLATQYNSLEKLLEHAFIQTWVRWVGAQRAERCRQ
eukprot:NODE_12779_length_1204_cov_11.697307.p1 GENE.NODE_12779_length_1204_cov_11.697307~~NODE_12779_length_1204_cov_11.697307.p1  ORF type:complete len:375 (+),score=117.74 NODE_12779_length_1204_cov_11.697307:124-1125(+)